jgi:superfamily II DNA or RNA helicase
MAWGAWWEAECAVACALDAVVFDHREEPGGPSWAEEELAEAPFDDPAQAALAAAMAAACPSLYQVRSVPDAQHLDLLPLFPAGAAQAVRITDGDLAGELDPGPRGRAPRPDAPGASIPSPTLPRDGTGASREGDDVLTGAMLDRFVAGATGQPLREGTRYAREARVAPFAGSGTSVTTLVRGRSDDFDVALWAEDDALAWRCTCPSWRDPCKHVVAAALVLRQDTSGDEAVEAPAAEDDPGRRDPAAARAGALEERRLAARRERLRVERDGPGRLRVHGASSFAYPVLVRGGADGPHGCTCPDFEANRLHTCKHVERVRAYLRSPRLRLPPAFRRAASRPRIYLHLGEVVEPRLFGRPRGRGSRKVAKAFAADGVVRGEMRPEPSVLAAWLRGFGSFVEPEALEWLDARARRTPRLPRRAFRRLLPRTPLDPYEYQVEGARFLATAGRGLLADEMGLGKTVQALLAAMALRHAEAPARRVTIVCPASLRAGWQEEIARWTGEQAAFVEGPRPRRRETILAGAPWLITHYEQVLRDHEDHAAHPPDLLILDEAQRAKGLKTRTARVLKAIPSRYLFALTGTPLENRLEEAYAIAQLIDQRLLPPLWQIDRDHFVRDEDGRAVVMYCNLGSFRSRLRPSFLRRTKEQVQLELPERIRSVVRVPLQGLARAEHDEKMELVRRIVARKRVLPADLDRVQRLLVIARRCCDGEHMLRGVERPRPAPKLHELRQLLEELALGEGRKVVVFSEWTAMTTAAGKLVKRLGLTPFHLHGSVPVKRRPALLRAFAEHEGPAVFLSTDAGGVGLNLQVADAVICLDLPWNPARLEQRIARVHRIGSTSSVRIVLMVAEASVEARILALHDTKRNVLENVWAQDGEDEIGAPGGSGAFKAMLEALVEQREENRAVLGAQVSRAAGAPDPDVATARGAPVGAAGGHGKARRAAEPVPVLQAPAPVVEPAALAQAVAAVAPTLPAEHRASLATVFRALAEALEA